MLYESDRRSPSPSFSDPTILKRGFPARYIHYYEEIRRLRNCWVESRSKRSLAPILPAITNTEKDRPSNSSALWCCTDPHLWTITRLSSRNTTHLLYKVIVIHTHPYPSPEDFLVNTVWSSSVLAQPRMGLLHIYAPQPANWGAGEGGKNFRGLRHGGCGSALHVCGTGRSA